MNSEDDYIKFFTKKHTSQGLEKKFKFLGESDTTKLKFLCKDVSMRILLIGDKNCKCSNEYSEKTKTEKQDSKKIANPCFYSCENCQHKGSCTIHFIYSLLRKGSGLQSKKLESFKANTYWSEKLKVYSLVGNLLPSFVFDEDKASVSNEGRKVQQEVQKKDGIVQIFNVGDVDSGLVLMSCCKFDLVLLYNTQLFEFFRGDYKVKDMMNNDKALMSFRNAVKLNRGPLDKYWVLPLVENFGEELREKDIQMFDHRWNIGYGVNLTKCPYEFLYRINETIDLQLRLSVFNRDDLMEFLLYTCEDLRDCLREQKNVLFFDSFQGFMGAEYANFMKRYGARKLIERDAWAKGDECNKSLFATFVAQEFYQEHKVETELNRLMRTFYHHAATMFNDRYGRQRLRESFEALRNFIAYNDLAKILGDKKNNLETGLKFLRAVVDCDFSMARISGCIEEYEF